MPSKTKKMKTSGPEHSDLTPWLSDSPQMNIGKYYEPKKFVWAKDEIDERELKYLVEVEVEEKDEDHEQLYQNISPECNCTGPTFHYMTEPHLIRNIIPNMENLPRCTDPVDLTRLTKRIDPEEAKI